MKKMLVVIDMQNDFINGKLGTNEAVEIIPKVKEKIADYRTSGYPVIFTRDTHQNDYLETQEGKNLPVTHCIQNTDGWNISSDLDTEGANIINKPTFGSVELAQFIKDSGTDTIELVGLCTDICVISNALLIKAFKPEAKITVDASCCAGVTPESHRNALESMKMCHINIINE